jgi:hypothetical protein
MAVLISSEVTAAWASALLACYAHSTNDRDMVRAAARDAGLYPLSKDDEKAIRRHLGIETLDRFKSILQPT